MLNILEVKNCRAQFKKGKKNIFSKGKWFYKTNKSKVLHDSCQY